MEMARLDKTTMKIVKMGEEPSDFEYWQSIPYEKRLEALEAIRTEYIRWKYDSQQGFQRVYRAALLRSFRLPS
jgi:hypothetical protein